LKVEEYVEIDWYNYRRRGKGGGKSQLSKEFDGGFFQIGEDRI